MEFWTTLIEVTRKPTHRALEALEANCTFVTGPYWIMEGDTDYLRREGLRFREVAEGAVGALGDLTEAELIQVCRDSYGVDLGPTLALASLYADGRGCGPWCSDGKV